MKVYNFGYFGHHFYLLRILIEMPDHLANTYFGPFSA